MPRNALSKLTSNSIPNYSDYQMDFLWLFWISAEKNAFKQLTSCALRRSALLSAINDIGDPNIRRFWHHYIDPYRGELGHCAGAMTTTLCCPGAKRPEFWISHLAHQLIAWDSFLRLCPRNSAYDSTRVGCTDRYLRLRITTMDQVVIRNSFAAA
jgi:hypothetical protein